MKRVLKKLPLEKKRPPSQWGEGGFHLISHFRWTSHNRPPRSSRKSPIASRMHTTSKIRIISGLNIRTFSSRNTRGGAQGIRRSSRAVKCSGIILSFHCQYSLAIAPPWFSSRGSLCQDTSGPRAGSVHRAARPGQLVMRAVVAS